jgi:hypothetical protein
MFVVVAGSSAAPRSAAACPPRSRGIPLIQGAPSQSLLSILGVLRRPATPADVLPPDITNFFKISANIFAQEVFANYIRRARVISGLPYYVWPVLYTGCGAVSERRQEGMMLTSANGWGGAGTAAMIEHGTAIGSTGGFGHTTIEMLIPDGVATVTLHYPAGTIGGFDRHHAPAFTTTASVVGNLLVVTVPRGGNRLGTPMTMTWRTAGGEIVKTFSRL